ncbi:recombinase family protein [Mobiluncus curtisii]|uniref:recombinase family protein n=1 Tax=Mobiluncus curtisii TaxID=2051 RepID=UPI0001E09506|nr:recombinase family protein [Mobiluncus curtisii]EFL94027.1 resolvase, N-terminal domain protein [Mobiluncus curtisii subsp. curtisii ATCC 35241]QQT12906.1 recombinase family protein [Mobiluncus curtisii]STY77508.1 Transposon Tn3 resolvase [Mobiluncus curtisii subsp. curtisii]
MVRTITTIPATRKLYSGASLNAPAIKRVAGYARVSTDHEDQVTSYAAQVDYYTRYITEHAGWKLAGIYTDEGITGTSTKRRVGFQTMIADALAGKIDLIITKSVSRFARNTVDSLTTVRQLKDAGVEVYFEKENIWTFDAKGELLITIMSSLAQEEARSISENVTWGHRKRFADGKVTVPFSRFLGYDRGEDGNLVINEEQAKLVRYIYTLYLDGGSLTGIAKQLQAEGHKTASGNPNWSARQVRSILTNEKYKGDALLQKSYIADFLTKKLVKNEGEVPQYYVTGNHEPIIAPAVWDFVQAELTAPATGRRSTSRQRTFSGKIRCGQCGAWYGSKTWHAGSKYEKRIWRCNHKYAGRIPCATPHVSDEQITTAFLDAVHHLLANRDQVDELVDKAVRAELDTTDLHIEADQLFARVGAAAEAIDALIARNARVAQDQTEYQRRFDKLNTEHARLLADYDKLLTQISDLESRQAAYRHYREELDKLDIDHIEFTPYLWHTLLDHAEMGTAGAIMFTFRDGTTTHC